MAVRDRWLERIAQPQEFVGANVGAGWVAAWSFGVATDQASGEPVTQTTDASLVVREDGQRLSVSGISALGRAVLNCADADKPGAGDFTVAIKFRLSTSSYCVVGRWNTGGSPSTCDWLIGSNNPPYQFEFIVAVGATTYTATISGTYSTGEDYGLIARRRGTTITLDRYDYATGARSSASTTNAGITTINSNSARALKLGEIDAGAGYNSSLESPYLGIANRALTDEEVTDWFVNPSVMFEPERIWVPVSAGGGAAAALEGAATGSASATGALTTQIPLAGAVVLQTTAAGSLTTAVQLAGAALAAGQAVGSLSTAISLTGAAASVTTAAGGLTTQIRLDGAGLAAALASGTLAGGAAALAGDAQAGAQATGGITTLIVLQGAAVGAALAAGDLTAPGSGLAGAATAGAVASGALTTQIPLAGGATVSVIAAGDVTTTVSLAGAAVGVVSATGDLVVALALDGAAVAAALAGASLSTAIVMEGAAVAGAVAGGQLLDPVPVYAEFGVRKALTRVQQYGRRAQTQSSRRRN